METHFKVTALRHGVDIVDFHIRCNEPVFRNLGQQSQKFEYRLRDERLRGFILGAKLLRFEGKLAVVELEYETSYFNNKTIKKEAVFPVKFHESYLKLHGDKSEAVKDPCTEVQQQNPNTDESVLPKMGNTFVLSWLGAYVKPKVDLTDISYNRTLLHSHPVGKPFNAILLS